MDAPAPRTMTISRGQKASMFIGAALCGSWTVGVFTVFLVDEADAMRPMALAMDGFTILCNSVVAMVFGAWLGGLVSFVWCSPRGRQVFWRLTGGALGIMLPSAMKGASAMEWLSSLPGSGAFAVPFLVGFVNLSGMLLGLLIGHAVAWVDSEPGDS